MDEVPKERTPADPSGGDEPDTMTPDLTLANETIACYERAIEHFAEFRSAWKRTKTDHRGVGEAYKRLIQLWYVLYRVRSLTARDDTAIADFKQLYILNPPGFYVRSFWPRAMGTIIELHAESFYYFAFRLGRVLQRMVPGFKNFDPVGVRDVRNWLIEHAERDRGVMDHSFQFNLSEGAILKPNGGGLDRVHDAGLYPNAKQFIEEFQRRLEAAQRTLG
jgi:hypothetical protein